MTTRRSLHIGLNALDEATYHWDGLLQGCEADAASMRAVAEGRGFQPTTLLTAAATLGAVTGALASLAGELVAGDFLFLTYSGHGGQVPAADEPDGFDETWCLYDTQLLDDEIYVALLAFAPGVRIVVLSDSCHSGSVTRGEAPKRRARVVPDGAKQLPLEISTRQFEEHRAAFDARREVVAQESTEGARADVILLSGCRDDQTSADGTTNGAFTEAFLKVWAGGSFAGSYNDLRDGVAEALEVAGQEQRPAIYPYGPGVAAFLQQQPLAP